MYGKAIPRRATFAYLGAPFKPSGHISTIGLITANTTKALTTFAQLTAIGVSLRGFGHLLSTRFYTQIIRAQLDYGPTISSFNLRNYSQLEYTQNKCIRFLFGGHQQSSVKTILQMARLPTMQERAHTLQTQFLFRSLRLPDDALLTKPLLFLKQPNSRSKWHKLPKNPLWQRCSDIVNSLDKKRLKQLQFEYLQANLNKRRSEENFCLLSACRPLVCLDPILWLPVSRLERSRCIRWRLE